MAVFVTASVLPLVARAFSLGAFLESLFGLRAETQDTSNPRAAPFPFLASIISPEPQILYGGGELQFVGESALEAVVGPLGNIAQSAELTQSYKITAYVVRSGDTLGLIAKTFGVSESTIRWANDLPRGSLLKEGEVLVILPVSGVQHTVKSGDTIRSIAKKYGGDIEEILEFNGLASDDKLALGSLIIIPDGELSSPTPGPAAGYVKGGGPAIAGYFQRPISAGKRTQGLHGYNGVDLAASCLAPVYASQAGQVVIARSSGWNGGYGNYVALVHPNGTQTLYAHLASALVGTGLQVAQGQTIGSIGRSGKATGCHLHFEVRGAKNPF